MEKAPKLIQLNQIEAGSENSLVMLCIMEETVLIMTEEYREHYNSVEASSLRLI